MFRVNYRIAIIPVALLAVSGCDSIGQTNNGPPPSEIKKTIDAMPLETRVKIEMGSPAPMDQKRKLIEDMYTKAGQKMPDEIAKQIGSGNAH
jgi:hypothetical protein